jgi:glycosidase
MHDATMMFWGMADDLGLRLDGASGLPVGLLWRADGAGHELPLRCAIELDVGGTEQPAQPYGLAYAGVTRLGAIRLRGPAPTVQHNGYERIITVPTSVDGWSVDWEWRFRQQHPRIGLSLVVAPPADGAAPLRNVRLALDIAPPDLADWCVEAPGNALRPGVAAAALRQPVSLATAGSVMGSTGLLAMHRPADGPTLVLWPFSRTEIGATTIETVGAALRCVVETGMAGRVAPGQALRYGELQLELLPLPWPQVRDAIPAWYGTLGLATPHDRPGWIAAASILEVQIGASVFAGGYQYAPYPTVRDVLADLERIHRLGFDVLQIMPRQPYPSYNVHDYADITTSYGDEADLRQLVIRCHELGMRVILDILLHGVIDQDVMAETVERVRTGPYMQRLEQTSDTFHGTDRRVLDAYAIAWCRHILDFAPYWSAGSPPRHPLVDAHPEWFLRDSGQRIIGIYTRAFDVANVAWQRYFTDACVDLVQRLDVDGFRFDAPTYNRLPNWSAATAARASYSPLGCLQLFDQLRVRLKQLKPDAILYTEPSGVLFRQAMDITYNYDEQWLIGSLMARHPDEAPLAVRHGQDLAAWFRERNAVLPPGSLITHHIDSHDTFWWPLPGGKWRREQFGVAAARALLAVFALSGGAYMTFIGGEAGLDDDLARAHRLRASLPALRTGAADYAAVTVDHTAVYAVVRQDARQPALVLVNLAAEPVTPRVVVRLAQWAGAPAPWRLDDVWNDEVLPPVAHELAAATLQLTLACGLAPFQPRVLLLRPDDAPGRPQPVG